MQHVGQVRGKMAIVAGADTYITAPADGSNKKIILFFGDVYGPMYVNSQLIMDYWADNGECRVAGRSMGKGMGAHLRFGPRVHGRRAGLL